MATKDLFVPSMGLDHCGGLLGLIMKIRVLYEGNADRKPSDNVITVYGPKELKEYLAGA